MEIHEKLWRKRQKESANMCTLVMLKERYLNILLCDHLISFTYKPIFFHLLLLLLLLMLTFDKQLSGKGNKKTTGEKFEALSCKNIAQQRRLIWEPYWNLKLYTWNKGHEFMKNSYNTFIFISMLVGLPFLPSTSIWYLQ